MSNPTVCLYHFPAAGGCTDGFTAAWVVQRKFRGSEICFIPVNYGEPPPHGLDGQNVLIVDFSYKADVMREIAARARSVLVLDHHKTAQTELTPLLEDGTVEGMFEMALSGAMLTWHWFYPHETPPALVSYVQDRDLWKFDLPYSREISAALASYTYDFGVWDNLALRLSERPRESVGLVAEGESILRARTKDIAEALKGTLRYIQLGGFRVPVANLPKMWGSEACDVMARDQPFAAYYFDRTDGRREFGLRSRPGGAVEAVDVAMVAEKYGGGGHVHAAGFIAPFGWLGDASGVFSPP